MCIESYLIKDYIGRTTDKKEFVSLINDVKNHNSFEALQKLISIKYPYIMSLSKIFYLASQSDDDLIQIAMIALWSACKSYKEEKNNNPGAFLNMSIKRRIITAIKKENRKKRQINNYAASLEELLAPSNPHESLTLGSKLVNEDLSIYPEKLLMKKEDDNCILQYIKNRFTDLERKAFILYLKGKEYDQIANDLKVETKSIDNALYRAKNKMVGLKEVLIS